MATWKWSRAGVHVSTAFVLAAASGCGITDAGGNGSCRVDQKIYADGTTFSPDGCNQCRCDDGRSECTLMECQKACGGELGGRCASDEYCAYTSECGFADGASHCATRPTACPEIYAPVCGCDGKTYSSACEAGRAGFGFQYDGKCGMPGDSCTINGQTYPDGARDIVVGGACNKVCTCHAGRLECIQLLCPPAAASGIDE